MYVGIEFEEMGECSVVPHIWTIENKLSYWPKKSHKKFEDMVLEGVLPKQSWPLYKIKKILFTCGML